MPYCLVPFQNQYFYHVYNRGINKQNIFENPGDYERFLKTLDYYQYSDPKPRFSNKNRFKVKDYTANPKIVEIICYCLMPNHFHLLLRQLNDNGIVEFVSKVSNSYTKSRNLKYNRIGPLLQGEFKAVLIENDEQLTHTSRYIHLNPYVADLAKKPEDFPYSSYSSFIGLREVKLCVKEPVLELFHSFNDYKEFIDDHAGYARELESIKHLLIDVDY